MSVHEAVLALMLWASVASPVLAGDEAPQGEKSPIIGAIEGGKLLLDVRYRFEYKAQDEFSEDAYANTVRTRLGFETAEFYKLKFLVEFENVASIGDDHFNSTTNGLTQFPVIADPNATDLNRAQVTFMGLEKTPVTIGRQRFNLNNHRFIGAVDFRQNQQTFDAALVSSKFINNLNVEYLYISRVHRIFGDDHPAGEFDSDSHVISAGYNAGALGTLKVYGVLLDLEEAPGLSSATWGARYENIVMLDDNAGIKIGVVGEYASQKDYAANPIDYKEDYIHGEASLHVAPFTAMFGFESLGGDGAAGFATPLATLHKFQGFADVFLMTPAAGIEDLYATLSYGWRDLPVVGSVKLFGTYHEFESELGDLDFGNEIDAGLAVDLKKHWSLELKGAFYDGAGAFADRSLIWASLRFQY
ncbi:alginate export family protein [Hyphococcus sp.]|uniref:alginate export family protein n=1 Tax=Hyphococcus sp. TaxID=2038636 RepID=UPI002083B09D|nr:MAG: hypothetical protein DHS20C04_08440 [Marinicaulis sp.]